MASGIFEEDSSSWSADNSNDGSSDAESLYFLTTSVSVSNNAKQPDGNISSQGESTSVAIFEERKREKLDTAVKAIMKDGMSINRARDRFQVSYQELDEALLKNGGHKIVHHAKDHRKLAVTPSEQEAMNAVIFRGMSETKAAMLHKLTRSTLKRRLIEEGYQGSGRVQSLHSSPASTRMEEAILKVVEQDIPAHVAGKECGIGTMRLRQQLKVRGYVYKQISRWGGKWSPSESPGKRKKLAQSRKKSTKQKENSRKDVSKKIVKRRADTKVRTERRDVVRDVLDKNE